MWSVHTMEHYSFLKKNEVLIYATIWTNLKNMLSEESQLQKAVYCMIPCI